MKDTICLLMINIIFLGASCTQKENINSIEIYIDFESIETLDLSEKQETILEISDNSIIERVDELLVTEDKYFIRSGSDLFLFNPDGTFNVKIGNKGAGPHEFVHFNSFFIKNGNVHIYDAMGKKMLAYDFAGNFVNSTSLADEYADIKPNRIYPIQGNKFIARNTFGGEHREIPSYSILGDDYKFESNIHGRYLKDGFTTPNNFFSNDGFVLFWEILNDTIFSVKDSIRYEQKYFVNFNKRAMPEKIKKLDLLDAFVFSNKPENIQKYATLVRNVNENESFLRFTFVYNREIYYVKYGKPSKKTKIYRLAYKDRTIGPDIYFDGDSIFMPVNIDDPDLNPSIITFNESIL